MGMEDSGEKTTVQRPSQFLLNSPDPPGIVHELKSCVTGALFRRRKLSPSPSSNNTTKQLKWCRSGFSMLQGIFPIFKWGRNYQVSNFKNDLMAGLTLASLCIPQVNCIIFFRHLYYSFVFPFLEMSLYYIL